MTRERKPFISLTAKMTPRHRELISLFDGLLYSSDRTIKGILVFNNASRGQVNQYQLMVDDANDLRKLIEAECALEALKSQNKIDDWHRFLSKHNRVVLQPDRPDIDLNEFNNIVSTAMEVAKAANWTRQSAPQTDAFMERVLVGAVVAYVMNRFDIKRV